MGLLYTGCGVALSVCSWCCKRDATHATLNQAVLCAVCLQLTTTCCLLLPALPDGIAPACAALQMRASAFTVAHVVPMVALGSTAPLMAAGFVAKTGSLASPAYVNIIMAAVTAVVVARQAWTSHGRGVRL